MNINTTLTKAELVTAMEALLFSSSVHIVSDVHEEHCRKQIDLAKKLKSLVPDIKLPDIQFLQEAEYEEPWTEEILAEFKDNLKVVHFGDL